MVENAFNNCSENKLLLQREKTMKKILLLTAISILLTGSSGYAAAKKSNTGIKKTATKSTARVNTTKPNAAKTNTTKTAKTNAIKPNTTETDTTKINPIPEGFVKEERTVGPDTRKLVTEDQNQTQTQENAVNSEKNATTNKKTKERKAEWQVVWSDEFDGNSLDQSKWSYWENGTPWKSGNYLDENGNFVDEYGFKAKQYYLRDNVKVEDGNLVITVKKEDNRTVKINGKDRRILYSSGGIHTKDKYTVQEGKIEMRAAMPEGIGVWPAFWTWPADYSQAVGIPAKEEIDIFEIYGDNLKRVTGTAHALKADNTYESFTGSNLRIRKSEDLTKFNTYAVEWNDKEIKWLFNGRVYKKVSMKKVAKFSENTFKLPHFLMINVAVQEKAGEDGNVKFPTELKVDYVRVYKKQ